MNKIYHYSVFAAAPGGGKQFAIVEGVSDPEQMQRIAAQSGQPLTGFIYEPEGRVCKARFFSPTKEKGASDSGALVVAHHLLFGGLGYEKNLVQMNDEKLDVYYLWDFWWSSQGDMRQVESHIDADLLLLALNLSDKKLSAPIRAAGAGKVNSIVPVKDIATLDSIQPDMNALIQIQTLRNVNGFIVVCLDSPRAELDFRWFSPAKNLPEDNAGSYTLASLCGYLVREKDLHGKQDMVALQGFAMGKSSELRASFYTENEAAVGVDIGGKVEFLEVSQWD